MSRELLLDVQNQTEDEAVRFLISIISRNLQQLDVDITSGLSNPKSYTTAEVIQKRRLNFITGS